MNNLMIESVRHIYENGAITIKLNDTTYKLLIDKQGNLVIEYLDKETGNKKCTTNSKSVNIILTNLFRFSVMTVKNDSLTLEASKSSVDEHYREVAINNLYSVYIYLLRNRDIIRDLIEKKFEKISDDKIFSEVVENVNNNCKRRKTRFSLENIIQKIEDDTAGWLILYKFGTDTYNELNMSYIGNDNDSYAVAKTTWDNLWADSENIGVGDIPKEYIEDATKKINKSKKNKKTASQKEKTLDVIALKKNHIAYEILNDREFVVDPAIGRDAEIRDVGAAILTNSRSPIILGEPGVGKTAVVEGLAYRIKNGLIGAALKDKYILKISPAAVVSGCIYRGQFEERMQELISYLQSHPNVILYMDEVHTTYKAGSGKDDSNDMMNMLKPYLENGSVKMIGATTKSEYEEYLMNDAAFTRRLKTIIVDEPENEVLREIIKNVIEKNEKIIGLPFAHHDNLDYIINILLSVTDKKHRTYKEVRYNPGLLISIIEEAFGYAAYDGANEVSVSYLIDSLNRCENIYKTGREEASIKLSNLDSKKKETPKVIEFMPIKE